MALLFCDSFEHYDLYTDKWSTSHAVAGPVSTTPRFGSRHYRIGSNSRYLRRQLPSTYATLILGGAWRFENNENHPFMTLYDGSTQQCSVSLDWSGGRLRVQNGNGTTLGAQVNFAPAPSVYYYIELEATIHNSAGVMIVRINGVEVLNYTSLDTQNSANAYATGFGIGEPTGNSNASWLCDDFYCCDTSGGAPTNTFLGDVRVECLYPNGNGNSSQLDGSDGNTTDNYLLVDDPGSPDEDTTYVESLDVGDKDTYAYENLVSSSGTVYGVQILPHVKKTDAGSRSIKTIARLSGTETDGPEYSLPTGYVYAPDIRETKPGGGAWTISDVNSAEFGMKVFA